ncbi:hypothetical protein HZA97_08355 [Candidatus Woesearchaeota archaeon]|nr:hypothetical protein [Candidatus Woesearchaeota archaeon]
MILERAIAESLTEESVAEMAMEYSSSFLRVLGSDKEIIIQPGQVLWTPDQARRIILSKSNEVSTNLFIEERLKKGNAFFHFPTQTACVTLKKTGEFEKPLIERVAGKESSLEKIAKFLRLKKPKYFNLRGFGSEIGHLIGEQVYQKDKDRGLKELVDVMSSIYEILRDTRYLCDCEEKEYTKQLEKEVLSGFASIFFVDNEMVRTLLVEKKLKDFVEVCEKYKIKQVKDKVKLIVADYIQTEHPEARMLFFEILRKTPEDSTVLAEAHKLLLDPEMRTIHDVFAKLGLPQETLERYRAVFLPTMGERQEYILNNFS